MIEQNITSTSRPSVRVELGPIYGRRAIPLYAISTNQQETGRWEDGEFIQDGSALITSATIEGIVPQGRKGVITIKDVAGVWPKRMMDLGYVTNGLASVTMSNIRVIWGWNGLKKNKYNETKHYTEITGFIEATKFDVLEDGVVTVTIEFVQFSDVAKADIMSYKLDDIVASDPEKLWDKITKKLGKNPTAIDVINYVLAVPGWDYPGLGTMPEANFDFGNQLNNKKIIIQCGSNLGMWEPAPLKGDNDLVNIEIGMTLSQWLEEMLRKVKVDEEGENIKKQTENGISVIFEKKNDKFSDIEGFEDYIVIRYDWKSFIDTSVELSQEQIDKIEKDYAGYLTENDAVSDKFTPGPTLFWKSDASNKEDFDNETRSIVIKDYNGDEVGEAYTSNKRILNWNSDLNTLSTLIHQFKNELGETLSNSQGTKEFEALAKILRREGSEEELREYIENAGLLTRAWAFVTNKGRVGFAEEGLEVYDSARSSVEGLQSSSNSGLRSGKDTTLAYIISQNQINMNVDIMGDPDMGTAFQGGTTLLRTNFSYGKYEGYIRKVYDANGEPIDLPPEEQLIESLNREWVLQKTTHELGEDGSYITKLELLGLPKMSSELALENVGAKRDGSGKVSGL